MSSGRYIPPHMRRRMKENSDGNHGGCVPRGQRFDPPATKEKCVAFFGDSFIKIFQLVKNRDVSVQGFKGASAKGLGRDGNENRPKIEQTVSRYRPKRLVFCFGSVDVHLSYYYSKVIKNQELDLIAVAREYIKYCASFKDRVSDIHIVGVYPSALQDEDVRESLFLYGSVPRESSHLIEDEDVTLAARQARVRTFNTELETLCREEGLHFECSYDEMVDTETEIVKDPFRDVADMNIHVVWETTLMIWIERWPWLKLLMQPGYEKSFQDTLGKYVQTKAHYAKRTHGASSDYIKKVTNGGL